MIEQHRDMAHAFTGRFRGMLEWQDLASCADHGLWRAITTHRADRREFTVWLYVCVKREVLDEYRRQHGDPHRTQPRPKFIPTDPDELEVVTHPDHTAYLDLLGRLRSLPQRKAAVLCLRYAGYTTEEIGRAFGVSAGRISQLTHAACEFIGIRPVEVRT